MLKRYGSVPDSSFFVPYSAVKLFFVEDRPGIPPGVLLDVVLGETSIRGRQGEDASEAG
ncbi:Hypothetical protein Minf_0883 [Methylacidiphilum infernorum V4]|uniref:Uncharacterized protein n=1 Tax=Methylacidiphilum infernorum (isolate V4) TaxID=481448 RepID=B3DUD5_METI4|nr:Hypothetical protein Minf_0883 [Methylacidiphilum infernorum V4]